MKKINGIEYRTKEDLRGRFAGLEQYRPGDPSVKELFIRMTSGTGGPPTMLAVSGKGRKSVSHYDEPALLISARNCLSLARVQQFLDADADASRILILSPRDIEHTHIASAIREFAPRRVYSFVSQFSAFLEKLSADGKLACLASVTHISLAGELISKSARARYAELLPHAAIETVYSFSEIAKGACAGCSSLSATYPELFGRVYHPLIPMSIVESDEQGVGEIAIHTPELGHYLTGDAGRLSNEACACGAPQTLFLSGRINYDVAHCAGATFHRSLIEQAFAPLTNYVQDYRIELRETMREGKMIGMITIAIVPSALLLARSDGEAFIASEFGKRLQVTKTRTLAELVRDGLFLPPVAAYADALPYSPKSIRMRKVD